MKKLLLILALIPLFAFSQDVVYATVDDKMPHKITEVTDTTLYLEQSTQGVSTANFVQPTDVASFSQNSTESNTLRLPSEYLMRSSNCQMASLFMAGTSIGVALLTKNDSGAFISGAFGALSVVFQLCGVAQLKFAGEALKRIQLESNGVIIKL